MAETPPQKNVILVVVDGTQICVPLAAAIKSKMVRNLVEDVGFDQLEEIPLAGVSLEVGQKVVEYMLMHQSEPDPIEDDDDPKHRRTDDITEPDRQFAKVNLQLLFELILAANYMDVKGLLHLMCKTFANMIKGKTPAQIRQLFDIKDDFLPEEVEEVLKENEWAREVGLAEART